MSWPVNPSNGQEVTINGIVYVFNAATTAWNRLYATTSVGSGLVTAITVTQAAQPNITSTGTMSNLTSTGTVNFIGASNVSLGAIGNVHVSGGTSGQYLQTDGSGALNWSTINSTIINNGNSNVNIPIANGNINLSSAGNANVVIVTGTGINVAGTLNTGAGNANVGNLGTATAIISVGNISTINSGLMQNGTSNIVIASGANISHYIGGNTTSQLTVTSTGANIAGDSTVSGNLVVGANLFVNGTTTTINSSTTRVIDPIVEQGGGANGAALSINDGKDRGQILHYYNAGATDAFMGYKTSTNEFILASNASVTGEVVSVNTYGNLHVGNANLGNSVTANYFTGNGSLLTSITGGNVTSQVPNALIATTVTANAQPNITSTGTLVSTTLASNANITMSGTASQISGANLVSANYVSGIMTTASQVNITGLGTLTGLSVNSTITANAFTSNIATGTAPLIVSSTTRVANLNVSYANVSDYGAVTTQTTGTFYPVLVNGNTTANYAHASNANLSFNVATGNLISTLYTGTLTTAIQPNITSIGTLSGLTVTGAIIATAGGTRVGNISDPSGTNTITLLSGAVTMLGNLTIGTGGTGNFSAVNANLGNVARANYFTGTLTTAIQPNITSVGTLASLTVTANVVAGNANLGNLVTANYFTSAQEITANAMTVSGLFTSGETTEIVTSSGVVSSSVTNYNLASSASFYHSGVSLGANWTANFQNVPSTDARSIVVTIMVVQGATPYVPNALQIDGTSQTIKWTYGIAPVGKASSVDIFSFGLIRVGSAWAQVLGSYTTYS